MVNSDTVWIGRDITQRPGRRVQCKHIRSETPITYGVAILVTAALSALTVVLASVADGW